MAVWKFLPLHVIMTATRRQRSGGFSRDRLSIMHAALTSCGAPLGSSAFWVCYSQFDGVLVIRGFLGDAVNFVSICVCVWDTDHSVLHCCLCNSADMLNGVEVSPGAFTSWALSLAFGNFFFGGGCLCGACEQGFMCVSRLALNF